MRFLFIAMTVLLCAGGGSAAPSQELPLSASYCTILRAFTAEIDERCPATPALGGARSMAAIPPGNPAKEQGYFVRFAFDSAQLTPAFQDHLKALSEVFQSDAMQGLCFKLVGHTDTVGGAAYNAALSEARAKSVRLFLLGLGKLDGNAVKAEGRGEKSPLPGLSGDDAMNRRVEILARNSEGRPCF